MIHRQLERAWRNICVIHEGETGEEELVGFSRVVSDGEAYVCSCDAFRARGLISDRCVTDSPPLPTSSS